VRNREGPPGLAATLSEWQLAPRIPRDLRGEEVAGFRERLAASLRAGHGLRVQFDLWLSSGPSPRVTFGCADPTTARWLDRVLLPVYGRTSWTRSPPRDPPREIDRSLLGRRVRSWPEALREPTDGPSASDCLGLALRGIPPGSVVRWTFSPGPVTWNRPQALEGGDRRPSALRASGIGARDSGLGENRAHEASSARATAPLFWSATVSLSPIDGAGNLDRELLQRVRVAVEAALRSRRGNGVRFEANRRWLPWRTDGFFVSEDELSLLLPGVTGGGGTLEPRDDPSAPVLPLGRAATGRIVGPPIEDDQGRHLAVLGETGMGKSSTLVSVARRATTLGGVVLFDPLGETAASFLAGLTDTERTRLVWVAPQGPESRGINTLEGIGVAEADPVLSDRRLNDLVHALRRVRSGRYVDSSYWGPRLEEMLTRALRAAASLPSGTLEDAHTLLATGGRTHQVVPPESRESIRELADRVRDRPEDAEGARRLLYEVVRSPVLRSSLCERSPTLHTRELVAPDRVVVISGDASAVGESVARYLLAVYLALVWSELLARPNRSKTFVVLDEAQWFSHESLAEMLRLGRRRNVHIVLATQTVGSLPEAVADAVWTNVSDFVAFRGSPEEARELSRTTRGLPVEDLLALPRGHAAVLLGKGGALEWVRTVGRPPGTVLASTSRDEAPGSLSPAASPPVSASPSPIPSLAPIPFENRPPPATAVLAWLRDRAHALPPGHPLEVELTELKRCIDPDGRAVREAGSILGRSGALVSTRRSPDGTVWMVDPERIPGAEEEAAPSPSSDRSQAPQPS